ncbi:hypothetical protein H4R19_003906 [Coemansia spiralis]|nr:hypothetical protein H4R19_003906 [Coemansia spiralis]
MERAIRTQTVAIRGGGTASLRMLVRRGVERTTPHSGNALRSSDSLSDTKIFVLLAAIVFVFLLALGVAMTRVSRGRRRQQDGMRHHIVAASSSPQTLSKTILDTLPVFEITDKYQLRLIRAQSPQVALNECFSGSYSDHEEPAMDAAARDAPSPCAKPGQCVVPACAAGIGSCGYALDSGNSSLCADDTSSYCDSDDIVLASNQGAVELAGYPEVPSAKRREATPFSDTGSFGRIASCSTPPVAFRYYGRGALHSATPSPPVRYSVGDTRWDGSTPDGGPGMYVSAGAVTYRAGSTQSLSRSPDRGTSAGVQWPCEARLAHRSHPEIVHSTPSPAGDGNNNNGLGSCPICLEEFEAGEQVRELPCLHRYHVACIDTWLVSRSTCCPYCKLDIRRWYYGTDLETGIPRSGILPSDAHGLAEEMLGDTAAVSATGPHGMRRGRRLRRIPRNRDGVGRLAQLLHAMRRTLV